MVTPHYRRLLVAIVATTILAITISAAYASSGGKDGYSGNPATKGGAICNACHTGGVVPTVTLSGPTTVNLGETNTFTLTISGGQEIGGGLDISVTAGTLVVTDVAGTKIKKGELVQTDMKAADVDGIVSWSFNWTAPSVAGTVIMYGSGASVDGNGNTSGDEANNDTLTITVQAGLQPPVASFFYSPSSPVVSETVTFNASSSYDPDGTIVSYSWVFGDGNTGSGVTATNAYSAPGSYNVTLTVTDNDGLTDSQSQTVTVLQPPVANFTYSPPSPQAGETVTFNASSSYDSDGTIVSYSWVFGDGNTGSGVTATNVYASAGSYNATLTVTDNDGLTNSTSQIVTVAQAPPVASFFYSPSSPATGETVTFNASASYDPDGTIVSYAWNFSDGNTSSGVTATNVFVAEGNYTVVLTVTDNDGLTDTDTQIVEVLAAPPPPQPPVANFTYSPASPLVGETVTFNASDSYDPDGTIISYSWDFGDGNTGTGVTATNVYSSPGSFNVTLTVTDNDGLTNSTSQIVTVLQPPVANFTFIPTSPLTGGTVTFNASDSYDPDGTIVSYAWDFGDGNTGSGVTATNVYSSGGTYNVTLTVTDNDGLTNSTSQTITVREPPVASFTYSPSSPVTGGTVTFDASSSYDSDGTIVSYSWVFGDGNVGSGVTATNAYSAEGNYTVVLTVTDNDELTDTTNQTVTVSSAPPPPPISVDVAPDEHGGGSICYICHAPNYPSLTSPDTINSIHSIGNTTDSAWNNCGSSDCHQTLNQSLQQSIHAQVSCKGCHAPLHVSYNEPGVGAWLFANLLNSSEIPAYKPSLPISFKREVYYYDSTNSTTALGADISSWGGEVHWAWTTISEGGITPATRYLVCLNCHFLTTNPAEAGLAKTAQGRTMIGIPEFTLELSPHSLTDSALREAATTSNQLVAFKPDDVRTLSGILIGIGIVGFAFWRKRMGSL